MAATSRNSLEHVIKRFTANSGRSLLEPEFSTLFEQKLDELIGYSEIRPGANILDLACGTGDMAIGLGRRGFHVWAIDCTPAQIERAQAWAARYGVDVHFACGDMRQINFDCEFDSVMLRDVIFSLFEDPADDQELIRRMAGALKPGGTVVFEVYNKSFAIRHGVEDHLFYDPRRELFVPRHETSGAFSLRLYDHDQWRDMLESHGLKVVAMRGWNWRGDPNPPPWRADFIVARRGCR